MTHDAAHVADVPCPTDVICIPWGPFCGTKFAEIVEIAPNSAQIALNIETIYWIYWIYIKI